MVASSHSVLPVWSLLLVAAGACSTHGASTAERRATNGTLNFVVQRAEGALDRPVAVCLEVGKPNGVQLQNGPGRDGAVDGRAQFAVGTRAADVVAHYAALLTRHGWVAGADFVASGNSLHFYGITALAAGAGDAQLAVHGATDSDSVPYRAVSPQAR